MLHFMNNDMFCFVMDFCILEKKMMNINMSSQIPFEKRNAFEKLLPLFNINFNSNFNPHCHLN